MKWTWRMLIEAAISWNFEKDLKMMGLKKWLKWVRGTFWDPFQRDGILMDVSSPNHIVIKWG